jgi:hypothetical protein
VSVLSKIPTVAKAISAGALAFAAALSVASQDATITTAEWVNIAIAAVVAAVGVWAIPNQPSEGGDAPAEG